VGDGYDARAAAVVGRYAAADPRITYAATDRAYGDHGHTPRELGLGLGESPWTVLTGVDNYYVPLFVETVVNAVRDNPDAGLVYYDFVLDMKGEFAAGAAHDAVNKSAARLAKSESVSRAGAEVFANPTRGELEGRKQINIWNFGPRIAELTFRYGTIANLKARGVDIGDIYELPKPAWWRQAFSYVGSFFRRAPAPGDKRKREDCGGPPSKKPTVLEDDDDDVVDLTV